MKSEKKFFYRQNEKKKKYLFGEASVPIQFTVIICKQDCSMVLGLDSNKGRYHSLSSQSSEWFLRKYSKGGHVKAKKNKGGFQDPCLRFIFKKCLVFWITKAVILWACWTLDYVFYPFNDKDHLTKREFLLTGWKNVPLLDFQVQSVVQFL